MATQEESSGSTRRDIGWNYNHLKDPKNRNAVTCNFCNKTTNGGINRAKQHQMCKAGNVASCPHVPPEVRAELWKNYNEKLTAKSATTESTSLDDFGIADENDELEVIGLGLGDSPMTSKGKRIVPSSSSIKSSKKVKGPMDLLFYQTPESILQKRKEGKGNSRQTSINDACDKEARARTIQYIARFFYQAGIPFNVAHLDSFKHMIEAIGRYGPNLKAPSYHELRVPLLKKELDYTNNLLKDHKAAWEKHGCSIMSDAWTDRRQRSIINFLVNCPAGTMFVESIDASAYMKTGEKIYELLDAFVERIGERNVVQVITDNGSNYVLGGKMLEQKRRHLYWTPCAAHCIDLMLEDIGKKPRVKKTIERAISLVGFIYNHTFSLNLLRTFTEKRELVRYGITRFATTFLTLQRIHKQKQNLRKMFTSDEWLKNKLAKSAKGKRATDTILMPSFWTNVLHILKIMGPIVRVLRLADNEKKPAMGYIYEAMDRAKDAIARSFNGREEKYKEVFEIIDKRWENQLHHPLHAAGYFLNPAYFYSNPDIEFDSKINDGLIQCIERLVPDCDIQDKIMDELTVYKKAEQLFGKEMAKRARTRKAPAEWWAAYGSATPHLQQLAIKILSLTISAAGCERNWSVFEQIHSKKRNRLEHKKMQDLVFIKYNQTLKARYDCRDVIDPISLNEIDASNEWLIGEMDDAEQELVFGDDNLTWGDVAAASGAGQPRTYVRQARRQSMSIGSSSRAREIEEEEANSEETEEEEIEGYKSSGGEESSDYEEIDLEEDDD